MADLWVVVDGDRQHTLYTSEAEAREAYREVVEGLRDDAPWWGKPEEIGQVVASIYRCVEVDAVRWTDAGTDEDGQLLGVSGETP